MRIIFLDVDGILNSMAYFKSLGMLKDRRMKTQYDEISGYHLYQLAKIYHSCNANIALTSTWRVLDDEANPTYYAIYQYLIESLAKYSMRVISKTPVIGQNRPLEIKEWLNNRIDKNKIKFVSLDDDFSKEYYDKYGIGDCLVKTKFYCDDISEGGLQPVHVEKAIKILNGE